MEAIPMENNVPSDWRKSKLQLEWRVSAIDEPGEIEIPAGPDHIIYLLREDLTTMLEALDADSWRAPDGGTITHDPKGKKRSLKDIGILIYDKTGANKREWGDWDIVVTMFLAAIAIAAGCYWWFPWL